MLRDAWYGIRKKRESADRERLVVSAQREEASQAVKTVEATQQAQRDAKIQVIQAEREAQKSMIEQKNRIELDALRKPREAEAQAKALKEIANAEAEAALKQAETLRNQAHAESEAETLRAQGARAKASATSLAEAEILKAKADSAMREAEAVKAKGLAEAEAEKAKAEALAAYDGVAQRVEILKLQLDAQVRIETARSQALGSALASMNVKMIGDLAAASLLCLVTLADGLGEVVRAAPQPVREIGQQLINKVTGDKSGDSLTRLAGDGKESGKGSLADASVSGITELALLLPEILGIAEKTLDINKMKGQTVGEVMAALAKKAKAEDQPKVEKAQHALSLLPILNDMPFEEVYLRVAAK